MKPSFTVCVIVKNMANTLPRLGASLKEFLARGGEWIVVDTGSTDDSPQVARALGAHVVEEGDRFIHTIGGELAAKINARFVVEDEPPIVEAGSRLFDFAEARNYCASLASNDWVSWADGDEAFTALDLDEIEKIIAEPNLEHVEYDFVFAHGPDGVSPAMAFTQSKMYRRGVIQWVGAVHEVIHRYAEWAAPEGNVRFLDPAIFHLEHWQEPREHRSNYLPGLAWDAWLKQTTDPAANRDRQWHYLAREMMWLDRPKSAARLFREHIGMNGWPAERAQSMIFLGDCYGRLGNETGQRHCYQDAYHTDATRREALLRLSAFYRGRNHHASAAYAAAALEIPFTPFYANNMADYRETPHALLYFAKGWMGDIPGARHHLLRALDYNPFHPEFLHDTQYYFEYPESGIEGWMVYPEIHWLYENAKGKSRIVEVGSWKGRSTHAIATAAGKSGGDVWAVDHFKGSVGEDVQHAEAKADPDAVYRQFLENTKGLDIRVRRADSLSAASQFPNRYFDMVFLDASHDYDSVKADILAWAPKCRGLLCGHDFQQGWPGVMRAVRELVGEPEGVAHSIWWKHVPPVSTNPLLSYLTRMISDEKPVTFIKRGDGEEACMAGASGANCDGHPYTADLGQKLRLAFHELGKMAADRGEDRTRVNVVPFSDQYFYNILLHRNDSILDAVKDFWAAVRDSDMHKVFVGPARLRSAARMLDATHVEIPLVNAWSQYAITMQRLFTEWKHGAIFIFCAGMPAKVWIANLLTSCPDVSCIDAGSAFDPLFVGPTRTEQLPMDLLVHEYREWLDPEFYV